MTIHLRFAPDPVRAQLLDRRMHVELASSVRYLSRQCAGYVPHDGVAIRRFAARIARGARFGPLTFLDYYDGVTAAQGDDPETCALAFARLASAEPAPAALRIEPLLDATTCERSRRFADAMLGAEFLDVGLLPPPASMERSNESRLLEALALMQATSPALCGEFRALVRELVPMVGDPSRAFMIDGGSHYQLWGSLFVNMARHATPQAMLEVLTHEAAHSLLFGLCTHEVLTLNDAAERYPSPLRTDERPMDGIYHAAFVSARMHLASSDLLASGRLDAAAAAEARDARDRDLANFEAGYAVVRRHAQLTGLGAALMAGARDYIESARAPLHAVGGIRPALAASA